MSTRRQREGLVEPAKQSTVQAPRNQLRSGSNVFPTLLTRRSRAIDGSAPEHSRESWSAVPGHRFADDTPCTCGSDIFGTNLFDIGLVFVVDAAFRGGPILSEVGRFAVFAAVLGTIVTTLFLTGLIERRDRTIARMGLDSFAVLAACFAGLAVLYTLR